MFELVKTNFVPGATPTGPLSPLSAAIRPETAAPWHESAVLEHSVIVP